MKRIYLLMALSIGFCSSSVAQKYAHIDKLYIDGDFTVTIDESKKVIQPREYVSTSQLGLEDSYPVLHGTIGLANYYRKMGKGSKKHPYYHVTVNHLKTGKSYYGILYLQGTTRRKSDSPEAEYYRVALGEDLFRNADQGFVSVGYEYINIGADSYETWTLWISNRPLKVD